MTRNLLWLMNAILRRNPLQGVSCRVRTLEYLNVGCGKKIVPHTINLNYDWYPGVDLVFDITKKKLPIATNRLAGIYAEHVLEHLPPSS